MDCKSQVRCQRSTGSHEQEICAGRGRGSEFQFDEVIEDAITEVNDWWLLGSVPVLSHVDQGGTSRKGLEMHRPAP